MIDLLMNRQKITINRLGFIESCSFDSSVTSESPIYLILFKEHSHIDPTCRQFDVSKSAINLQCQHESYLSLSYDKDIEGIVCHCTIQMVDNGFDWIIKIQMPYPTNHRFGVVYPTEDDVNILSFGEEVDSAVCNYFNVFKQTFRDQTLLKLPSLGIASKNKHIILCSDPDKNSQFYIHRGSPWNIRTTAITDNGDEFILHVRRIEDTSEMYSGFTSLYPDSESYIGNTKIENKYGILLKCYVGEETTYQLREYEYKIRQPSDKSLSNFQTLINEELNKYPVDFFSKIKLDGIYLCSDVYRKTEDGSISIPGFYLQSSEEAMDWLFFNVEMPFSWLIHHEIFHCVEEKLGKCLWEHGNMTFFKDEFDLVPENVLGFDDAEFRADLFGCLMSQTKKLKMLASTNNLLREQVDIIIEFMSPVMDLSGIWSSPSCDKELRYICAYTRGKMKRIPFGKLIEADFYLSSPESELVEAIGELHNWN